MKSNDSLENLFKGFNPTMSSEQAFMNKLNRKLEAVEYIKQMQADAGAPSAKTTLYDVRCGSTMHNNMYDCDNIDAERIHSSEWSFF